MNETVAPLASAKQRERVRRILRDAPDLADRLPAPVEELTREQASEFNRAYHDRVISAAETPARPGQLRWIQEIALATGNDPAKLPPLTARQARQLIERWAPRLPRDVRRRLAASDAARPGEEARS